MSYEDRIKTLRSEVQQMVNQAKTMYAELETKGDKATEAERTTLNNLIDAGQVKRAELVRLEQLEEADQHLNQPAAQPKARTQAQPARRKSWGRIVVESPEFKNAPATSSQPHMDRVNVKAVYGSADGGGGALIQAEHIYELMDIPERPPSILEFINQSTTNSDAVEYPVLASRTNNAAPTPEFSSGNFGLKPESDYTFTLQTTNVRTIATWIAASRRILQDAPMLSNYIDTDLTEMLRVALENQVIAGSGTGENFTGILNTSGILTRTQGSGARSSGSDTVADTVRRGITDVVLQFYTPNVVVLNPTDAESIELSKDTLGQYIKVIDPATGRIWRVPHVETAAVAAKTGMVGDLRMAATIWDRNQTEVRVGEPNDFFLRNALAILGELRAAFAVTRPSAVEKLTFS